MSEQVIDKPAVKTIHSLAETEGAKDIVLPQFEEVEGITADIIVDGDIVRVGWHESNDISGVVSTFNDVPVEENKEFDPSQPMMILSDLGIDRVMQLEEDVQGVFLQSSPHVSLEWSRGAVGAHKTLYDAVGREYERMFAFSAGTTQCMLGGKLDWPQGRNGKPRVVFSVEGDVTQVAGSLTQGDLKKVIDCTRQDIWREFKDAMPGGPDELLIVAFARSQKDTSWKVMKIPQQ
jgi:hypothetical protein